MLICNWNTFGTSRSGQAGLILFFLYWPSNNYSYTTKNSFTHNMYSPLILLAFLSACSSTRSTSFNTSTMPSKDHASANINIPKMENIFKQLESDFDPCHHQEPTWHCNTSQFCEAAYNMKKDGCFFLPNYCDIMCYSDIVKLNNTDCMKDPSDPWLEHFAMQVRHEAQTWNRTCDRSTNTAIM